MRSPDELTLPKFKEILKGTGKWHIQGHVDTCLPKFSPSFIWGIGNVDGEIVETLWSLLNLIARSSHQMTLPLRAELMDAHMNNNNYKKMIGMGESLLRIGPMGSCSYRVSSRGIGKKVEEGPS
ncbi:hypothetical protein OF83DRAFT_1065188 [Amylostereum chailletii]|nr:hypothetical protein OF83DRAFT_1065188 [Amylostereum chailletii]